MKPIQLWLPLISGGAARPARQRDIQRLHAEWDGHDVLWTQPGWCGPKVWVENGAKVGCISGEELECFRIIHVGGKGGTFGPAAAEFEKIGTDKFLDAWLKSEVDAVPSNPGSELAIKTPTNVEGGVSYRSQIIETGPKGHYPIKKLNDPERTALAQWPPDKHDPMPVSPQSESSERYPVQSNSGLVMRIKWKEPFSSLMPMLPSEDDLFARVQMKEIIELARSNKEQARKMAEVAARDCLVEGQSTVNLAWLKPIIAAEDDYSAAIAVQSRFDVEHMTLAEVYKDPTMRQKLRKRMGVRRALGIPGLAWALLQDRLNAGQKELLCELCGSPIKGQINKKFCSQSDSLSCYRARKRRDRKRARK